MDPRRPTTHHRFASPLGLLVAVGTVGDPEGTRTVTSIIALLVAIGLAMVMIAIWLRRSTRPDPELLAPLEMMGERKWRRGDPMWQRRRLDELRPDGAQPRERVAAPPDIDEAFDRGPSASGFDDLHGDDDDELGDHDEVDDEHDEHDDHDDHHDDHDGGGATRLTPPPVDAVRAEAPTPQELRRPTLDELPEGEVDPEVLAAAMAELEAEFGGDRDMRAD